MSLFYILRSFNPRTHSGCDATGSLGNEGYFCFNPRTHSGCDPSLLSSIPSDTKFQSTHPLGVRLSAPSPTFVSILVSIHAPTRGATAMCGIYPLLKSFQSTHPLGVRREVRSNAAAEYMFQSTHPLGVRQCH